MLGEADLAHHVAVFGRDGERACLLPVGKNGHFALAASHSVLTGEQQRFHRPHGSLRGLPRPETVLALHQMRQDFVGKCGITAPLAQPVSGQSSCFQIRAPFLCSGKGLRVGLPVGVLVRRFRKRNQGVGDCGGGVAVALQSGEQVQNNGQRIRVFGFVEMRLDIRRAGCQLRAVVAAFRQCPRDVRGCAQSARLPVDDSLRDALRLFLPTCRPPAAYAASHCCVRAITFGSTSCTFAMSLNSSSPYAVST